MDADVRKIAHREAAPFIKQWHYSGRCPTGKNIYFGWFMKGGNTPDLFGDSLYAVADYGIGVNPYQAQALSRMTGLEVDSEHLLELKRLCRKEPKIDMFPLSAFLSRCHKMLRRDGYQHIVSFSDPSWGHTGGIYRASNFMHLGQTNAETHAIDEKGETRHRRLYFRYARRNNVTVAAARDTLGLTLIKTKPKDRWFIKI
jgi:hypothetical protein